MVQSNIDIQYILNPYACISYITDYINKGNTGLSKLLRNVSKSLETGDYSINDRLQKFANEFINGSLITAQEAVYTILSLPLSECSVGTIFVYSRKIDDRTRKLKSIKELDKLLDENDDIFERNIFEYYACRHQELEDICLADYVTRYKDGVIKNKIFHTGHQQYRNLGEKRKFLKYCRYKEDNEAE